jgi:hypothetical protein
MTKHLLDVHRTFRPVRTLKINEGIIKNLIENSLALCVAECRHVRLWVLFERNFTQFSECDFHDFYEDKIPFFPLLKSHSLFVCVCRTYSHRNQKCMNTELFFMLIKITYTNDFRTGVVWRATRCFQHISCWLQWGHSKIGNL